MLGLSPGGMSRRLDIGIAVCCACAITGELHASQIHGQEIDRWGPLIDASKPTASPDHGNFNQTLTYIYSLCNAAVQTC